jgi:hypothetical protein
MFLMPFGRRFYSSDLLNDDFFFRDDDYDMILRRPSARPQRPAEQSLIFPRAFSTQQQPFFASDDPFLKDIDTRAPFSAPQNDSAAQAETKSTGNDGAPHQFSSWSYSTVRTSDGRTKMVKRYEDSTGRMKEEQHEALDHAAPNQAARRIKVSNRQAGSDEAQITTTFEGPAQTDEAFDDLWKTHADRKRRDRLTLAEREHEQARLRLEQAQKALEEAEANVKKLQAAPEQESAAVKKD